MPILIFGLAILFFVLFIKEVYVYTRRTNAETVGKISLYSFIIYLLLTLGLATWGFALIMESKHGGFTAQTGTGKTIFTTPSFMTK